MMKARKKSGASAPKDKSMDYKNSLAKKYANEETTRLSLYESQCDFMTGRIERPKTGAGTYRAHANYMRNYPIKKALQERHEMARMNRKERREYKATKAENMKHVNAPIEKTVFVVFPLEVGAHFYRTQDGANNAMNKKYDKWIMGELECDYEDIKIVSMKESEATTILA